MAAPLNPVPEAVLSARNLLDFLFFHAREKPHARAVLHKTPAGWREASWSEVLERSRRLAEGLVALGIQPGDRVCVFAQTSYEWVLANFAIYGSGAVAVPIYASSTVEEAAYIASDCGAKALFVDHDRPDGRAAGRWTRVKEARSQLPWLEHCIGFELPSDPGQRLISLADLEARGQPGAQASPRALEERAAKTRAEDLAYIVYTSGTTGRPKGVMLTHGNWIAQGAAVVERKVIAPGERVLLFLPLAHAFALTTLWGLMASGEELAFAESVERAVDNSAEVGATLVTAVPRVFEKAYSKVLADGAAQPGVQGTMFTWGMRQFDLWAAERMAGRDGESLQWALARRLVFSRVAAKLKARFGGRIRCFVSGGAPLSRKIALFFETAGLLVCEGYGLTETCAGTFVNPSWKVKLGTVGPPMMGIQVKVADDGEVLLKGPQVTPGYYQLPKETAEAFDAEGWFRTGDIGELDEDGYLRITDRKKDLIKTSGGKYVAPQELENALKTEPLVSQVLVHGDRRKFVSALFTISEEAARRFAAERNIAVGSYQELTQRAEVRARVQAAVDRLNAAQPSYATIKRFAILDHDWSQDSGEITPSLKVKRKAVEQRYQTLLDGFYSEGRFEA